MLLFEVHVKFNEPVKHPLLEEDGSTDKNYIPEVVEITNDALSISMYNKNAYILPILSSVNFTNTEFNVYAFYTIDNKTTPSYSIMYKNVYKYIDEFIFSTFSVHPDSYNIKIIGSDMVNKLIGIDDYSSSVQTIMRRVRGNNNSSTTEVEDININSIYNIDLLGDFTDELNRIKANKFKSFHGHPVHYVIRHEERHTIPMALVHSLHKNNRGVSVCVNFVDASDISSKDLNMAYRIGTGNTIIFEINKIEDANTPELNRFRGTTSEATIQKIIQLSAEYSSSVLTIISVKDFHDKDNILGIAKDNNIIYVPLLPKNVNTEIAMKFLNTKAKSDGFKKYGGESLKELVYTPTDLEVLYTKWKTNHLIMSMGYNKINSLDIKKGLSFDPMARLNSMIGLGNVKDTVNQILSYVKMQKVYLEKGISTSTPCRHMVFYGNPGTAKTTVARLLANILKESDIITNGKIVEVGRSSLVGEYVGHTAVKTKAAIKSAKGGILFIDEAYALVDYKAGMFGDEAINTLVEEMDKVKDDTIIILAGYPDKMEKFLDTNPGLRSRIGFHIKFDNYSKTELMHLLSYMAKKEKFTLTKEALAFAEIQISTAMSTKDFGNGRFVRTLLEQAIMRQATRLSEDNKYIDMTADEIFTISSDDISDMNKALDKIKIGFGRD